MQQAAVQNGLPVQTPAGEQEKMVLGVAPDYSLDNCYS